MPIGQNQYFEDDKPRIINASVNDRCSALNSDTSLLRVVNNIVEGKGSNNMGKASSHRVNTDTN